MSEFTLSVSCSKPASAQLTKNTLVEKTEWRILETDTHCTELSRRNTSTGAWDTEEGEENADESAKRGDAENCWQCAK